MKRMVITIIVAMVISAGIVMAEETAPIDGFRDYKWGTPIETVTEAEISSDMREYQDYEKESEIDGSSVEVFSVYDGNVAGYDAKISYCFADGELTGGVYEIDVDKDDEDRAYKDLKDKYTGIYGEPIAETEGTGWGPFTLWIDNNKNLIYFDAWFTIAYLEADSELLDIIDIEGNEKYFGINILDELDKIGNTSGI